MKRLLLPLVLIAFAVICLGIVHIDNINEINAQSDKLRQKHQGYNLENHSVTSTNTTNLPR